MNDVLTGADSDGDQIVSTAEADNAFRATFHSLKWMADDPKTLSPHDFRELVLESGSGEMPPGITGGSGVSRVGESAESNF